MRIQYRCTLITCALFISFVIASCSGTSIEGSWKVTSGLTNFINYNSGSNAEINLLKGGVLSIRNADNNGRGNWAFNDSGRELFMSFTWSGESTINTVTLTNVKIIDGTISGSDGGSEVVLSKKE